jgi:tetratricopeptide (TPR) repeat protein
LYELLFPPRAKLDLDRSEHLHLIVDEDTAQFPWELLAAPTSGRDVAPLALRAGMLRQLQSTDLTRQRTSSPQGMTALFVGDPPTSYPRIPNAREEAECLASLFSDRGWDVERRIYGEAATGQANEWMDILNALHQRDYRVVHIAAHGVFDEDWRRSGVALGPLPEHRLTALEFEAMSSTPDLVFLNCCHLGRLGWLFDQGDGPDTRALERPHRVAGTVAQQLLRNGVRAVVVAGWPVDDFAAAAFATDLYQSMLDGHPLGKAVRKARLAAHEADNRRSNTWGAYQCYGDPDFEMVTCDAPAAPPPRLVSAAQLAREFGLAAIRASAATSTEDCEQVAQEVNQLRVAGADLVNSGGVLEALGSAFSELGRYPEAVDAYQQALVEERGEARLRTIEQLANLKVRLAVTNARALNGSPDRARRLFAEAAATLDTLDQLAGSTAERHALRGSLQKKRATTVAGAERAEALNAAREAYLTARRISSPDSGGRLDPYHINLWLQLVVLTSESESLADDDAVWLEALQRQVDDDAGGQAGYWERAAVADTLITRIVAKRTPAGVPDAFAAAEASYRKAFLLRSTVRQRDSVLTHLQDLSLLVPSEEAAAYARLFDSLQKISFADNR